MVDPGIGFGIGLQGTPREYTQIYQQQQQLDYATKKQAADLAKLKAAREKEQEKGLEGMRKQLQDQDKILHPLYVDKTKDAISGWLGKAMKAKLAGDDNWYNDAFSGFSDLQSGLNALRQDSDSYKNFEKYVEQEGRLGTKYVSKAQEAAYQLLKSSKSTDEFIAKAKKAGINSRDFVFNDNGSIGVVGSDRYDFNKLAQQRIDKNHTIPVGEVFTGRTNGVDQFDITYGMPRTRQEALKYSKEKNQPVVQSGEDIAEAVLSDEAVYDQYVERNDLEGKTKEQVYEHFLDNYVEPHMPMSKKTITTRPAGKGITINTGVPNATPGEVSFVPETGIPFGNGKLTMDGLHFSDDSIKVDYTLNDRVIDAATGLPTTNTGTKTVQFSEVKVVPTIDVMRGGKRFKLPIPEDQMEQKQKEGYTVEYNAFVPTIYLPVGTVGVGQATSESLWVPYDDLKGVFQEKLSAKGSGQLYKARKEALIAKLDEKNTAWRKSHPKSNR